MFESSVYFSAPPPLLASAPHLVCSGDSTGRQYNRQHHQNFQFQCFNFFHCNNIFLKHKQRKESIITSFKQSLILTFKHNIIILVLIIAKYRLL